MSIKLSRTPRLHSLLLLRQFEQSGVPSSHLRCLSLQVKQPVLTLLLLVGTMSEEVISTAVLEVAGACFLVIGEIESGSPLRLEDEKY